MASDDVLGPLVLILVCVLFGGFIIALVVGMLKELTSRSSRGASTWVDHYGDHHWVERQKYDDVIRLSGGECTERTCIMPSRRIERGARWHLAHDHLAGGAADYLGPAHPECNEYEAQQRGVTWVGMTVHAGPDDVEVRASGRIADGADEVTRDDLALPGPISSESTDCGSADASPLTPEEIALIRDHGEIWMSWLGEVHGDPRRPNALPPPETELEQFNVAYIWQVLVGQTLTYSARCDLVKKPEFVGLTHFEEEELVDGALSIRRSLPPSAITLQQWVAACARPGIDRAWAAAESEADRRNVPKMDRDEFVEFHLRSDSSGRLCDSCFSFFESKVEFCGFDDSDDWFDVRESMEVHRRDSCMCA